jgi:hypothetical protein
VGGEGDGVRKIASLFNVTRIYNAMAAVAGMRRAIALARDYAARRTAFGKPLAEQVLHLETLAEMQVELEGAFHLVFRLVELLGRSECGEASSADLALLRLLTPVAKLYTAKQATAVASEALEAFGGAGYIEDTGLPRLLRDAQVLSIWEGTTNVLSLDVLRALGSGAEIGVMRADIEERLARITLPELLPAAARVRESAAVIEQHAARAFANGGDEQRAGARSFAYAIARTYGAALLLEHAAWSAEHEQDRRPTFAALRWCSRDLAPLIAVDTARIDASRALALGLASAPDPSHRPRVSLMHIP